jgi:glucose-1-phosphate cytidylyltransferase
MMVAILAGGQGTRLAEETRVKAKAMVPIGEQPILWHLLKYYEHFGFNQFVIAVGYQADTIRQYFVEKLRSTPLSDGPRMLVQPAAEPAWTVELIDTGPDTDTGGRIKRLAPYLEGAPFMLTWCDGLADVDLGRLGAFHQAHGRLATLTAVHPPPRFGRLSLEGDRVTAFREKVIDDDEWINGAFFVLEPGVFEYIEGDRASFERDTLPRLVADRRELRAYRHSGFWQCMDTLKEAEDLNKLWRAGKAPWKVWA